MATNTKTKARFTAEMKIDLQPEHRDALDRLADIKGSTRTQEARTAIVQRLEAEGMLR